ncbi:MAG: hypothetical protein IV100_26605 [Myxococcales bacterium]|nr:hypothetical protein [Myxococcales bacterium]
MVARRPILAAPRVNDENQGTDGDTKAPERRAGVSPSRVPSDRDASTAHLSPDASGLRPPMDASVVIQMSPSLPEVGRREPERKRILVWLAIGLSAVSLSTGILREWHHSRAGNRVSDVLPPETALYLRLGGLGLIEEQVLGLDVWRSTLPLRGVVAREQQLVVSGAPFDLPLSQSLLDSLKHGVGATHVAVVPVEGGGFETLLALELIADGAAKALDQQLLSDFRDIGERAGVRVLRSASPSLPVHAARVNDLAFLAFGGSRTLEHVLDGLTDEPAWSLSDTDGFRSAFDLASRADPVFLYLPPAFQGALGRSIGLPLSPDESGTAPLGLAIRFDRGHERAVIGFTAEGDEFEAAEAVLAVTRKRALDVVPATASAAAAFSFKDGPGFWSMIRPPLLEAIAGSPSGAAAALSNLNRTQAETGLSLMSDVLPRLSGEVAIAVVPTSSRAATRGASAFGSRDSTPAPKDGADEPRAPGWVVVARSFDPEPVIAAAFDLASAWELPGGMLGSDGDQKLSGDRSHGPLGRLERRFRSGMHELVRVNAASGGPAEEVLCATIAGDYLVFGAPCSVVDASRRAHETGDGFGRLPSVAAALSELPDRNTAVAVGWLAELVALLPDSWLSPALGAPLATGARGPGSGDAATSPRSRIVDFVSDRFVVAAALTVSRDLVRFDLDVSPVSLSLLAMAAIREAARPESCERLHREACPLGRAASTVSEPCATFEETLRSLPADACERALRGLWALEREIRSSGS